MEITLTSPFYAPDDMGIDRESTPDWVQRIPDPDPFRRAFSCPSPEVRARARARRRKKNAPRGPRALG